MGIWLRWDTWTEAAVEIHSAALVVIGYLAEEFSN